MSILQGSSKTTVTENYSWMSDGAASSWQGSTANLRVESLQSLLLVGLVDLLSMKY